MNEDVIQEMVNAIRTKFNPEQIIVFGSWARGEANEDSDIDFLVIMPDEIPNKRFLQIEIRKALRGFAIPKDVVVLSKNEISKYKNINGLVYKNALEEGRVYYGR
ncbi:MULTISPECIES: nucleotidyltransferase domain-containing protein [Carboxydocella]|nr:MULTISPECIES: nucleotidyltransferase domain-containing protein [Carboxydocella]